MEEPYYKVGDRIRVKATGRFGEIEYISKDVNDIPKGYSVAFLLYSKRRFYTNKDDIEKIEDYPIGNPKFKLQEVVCIPDSKGGGVIKRVRQYNDTYMYDVVYTYMYNAQILNVTFSEEDLVRFNELFSNKTLISKEMEDKKSITPKFKAGETVYVKKTGRIATIITAPTYKGYPYYIKTEGGPGSYYHEWELKPIAEGKQPNIPIRSIKSLIEKSIVDPSINQAEKKAIDFFVRSVHTMGDSYVEDSGCYAVEGCLNGFKVQLSIIEKMAIEFYKKMRL